VGLADRLALVAERRVRLREVERDLVLLLLVAFGADDLLQALEDLERALELAGATRLLGAGDERGLDEDVVAGGDPLDLGELLAREVEAVERAEDPPGVDA